VIQIGRDDVHLAAAMGDMSGVWTAENDPNPAQGLFPRGVEKSKGKKCVCEAGGQIHLKCDGQHACKRRKADHGVSCHVSSSDRDALTLAVDSVKVQMEGCAEQVVDHLFNAWLALVSCLLRPVCVGNQHTVAVQHSANYQLGEEHTDLLSWFALSC
tara:strand:- start:28 stop:498 length:471 start_codon:yes stop_codon:yes gene_type:complete